MGKGTYRQLFTSKDQCRYMHFALDTLTSTGWGCLDWQLFDEKALEIGDEPTSLEALWEGAVWIGEANTAVSRAGSESWFSLLIDCGKLIKLLKLRLFIHRLKIPYLLESKVYFLVPFSITHTHFKPWNCHDYCFLCLYLIWWAFPFFIFPKTWNLINGVSCY